MKDGGGGGASNKNLLIQDPPAIKLKTDPEDTDQMHL